MNHQRRFVETFPTPEGYWRAIVLFGKNSSSYKFALAKSLFEIVEQDKTFVPMEELAEPFSRHLVEHLKRADRQCTSSSSRFLETCRDYNRGVVTEEHLLEQAVRLGFGDVIDAFHIVNGSETRTRFFMDERKPRGGITVTDELFALSEDSQYDSLPNEVEARWRMVETAWSLKLAPRLLTARYDSAIGNLYVEAARTRRTDLTSCKDALNGYQRGRCFYCSSEIGVESKGEEACDVDHFFPHVLSTSRPPGDASLDGVWNLVLSCRGCNRGKDGKFARVPDIDYLERLDRRNNYLIQSHHPLRETLLAQTGRTEARRRSFLERMDAFTIRHLVSRWTPSDEFRPVI